MKKKALALTGLLILLGIGMTLNAENVQNTARPREKLRDALQIRQQMREIEKKVIDNDAELQGILEQMKGLHQQMRQKLDAKLANDAEYQGLKNQINTMQEQWKGRGGDRKPGGKALPSQGFK